MLLRPLVRLLALATVALGCGDSDSTAPGLNPLR